MHNALKIWVILKFIDLEVKFSNINMTYSLYAVESTYTGAYMYLSLYELESFRTGVLIHALKSI